MATKSFVVLLWGVLLLGWRGTEGQLVPETITTPSTNDIPADVFMVLLKDMVNNNEDLDFLKPLLNPSTQTQSPTQGSQEMDDDHTNQGPTFAMAPQQDDDDDGVSGTQCTCPNSNGGQGPDDDNMQGGSQGAQEPDDDNMQGGSQSAQEPDDDNMQSGSQGGQGSSPVGLLSMLLKLMNMNN